MKHLRRYVATNGQLVPYDDYRPPWWWTIVQASKYYGVHPEVTMGYPSVWVQIAMACMDVESHAAEAAQRTRG